VLEALEQHSVAKLQVDATREETPNRSPEILRGEMNADKRR